MLTEKSRRVLESLLIKINVNDNNLIISNRDDINKLLE